jgi:hypothetical protein
MGQTPGVFLFYCEVFRAKIIEIGDRNRSKMADLTHRAVYRYDLICRTIATMR